MGVECVGWKLKPPFNIGCSEVVWKVVEVLTSGNDCGEQPARVICSALLPTTMV